MKFKHLVNSFFIEEIQNLIMSKSPILTQQDHYLLNSFSKKANRQLEIFMERELVLKEQYSEQEFMQKRNELLECDVEELEPFLTYEKMVEALTVKTVVEISKNPPVKEIIKEVPSLRQKSILQPIILNFPEELM